MIPCPDEDTQILDQNSTFFDNTGKTVDSSGKVVTDPLNIDTYTYTLDDIYSKHMVERMVEPGYIVEPKDKVCLLPDGKVKSGYEFNGVECEVLGSSVERGVGDNDGIIKILICGIDDYNSGTLITGKKYYIKTDGKLSLDDGMLYGVAVSPFKIKRNLSDKDVSVNDIASWKRVIERVSANLYKFKNNITGIRFKNNCSYGISSVLSGNDTWGKIQTNNCKHIEFESGAYISVGDTPSSLEINTDNCFLQNVGIKGDGLSPAAIDQSFLLSAINAVFSNCWTSNRISNKSWVAFKGTPIENCKMTSQFFNCKMFSTAATSGTAYMFWNCMNISNSLCHSNSFTASDTINNCSNINNFQFYNNTATSQVRIIVSCENINNVYIYKNTVSESFNCFFNSNLINNVMVYSNTQNTFYGFVCFNSSYDITNVKITSNVSLSFNGFFDCLYVTNCKIYDHSAKDANAVIGFYETTGIVNCASESIKNTGTGGAYGYQNCKKMQMNSGQGNKTATYNACYADMQGTQAVANTAAGGYNS
jgi:hypothetical protein